MKTATKSKPTATLDIATSVAVNIARLLVGQDRTPASYREHRDYVNTLAGVDIRQLPRDAEFGYEN